MKDEFTLIRNLLADRPKGWGRIEVDVGDDAAVISPSPGRSTVVTCDTMMEGVHFLPETMSPENIGWKLLASNISDIAAMGGEPRYAFISLAVPDHWDKRGLQGIYRGLYELATQFKIMIMGGDTVRSPHSLVLTLTLLGEVEQGEALTRSMAKPGDVVFITGSVGDAAAGLHLLLHEKEKVVSYPKLVAAHQQPMPQVKAGRWLVTNKIRAACDDISDGLAQEAWEIASASNVRLVLYKDKIPLSQELQQYASEKEMDPWDWILYGGEDFQLLGTTSAESLFNLREKMPKEFTLSMIGVVESGGPAVVLETEGERKLLPARGYNHFIDR